MDTTQSHRTISRSCHKSSTFGIRSSYGFFALYAFLDLELDLSINKETAPEFSEELIHNTVVNRTVIIDAGTEIFGALAQIGRRIEAEFERFFTEIELNGKLTLITIPKRANAAVKSSIITTVSGISVIGEN